MRFGIACALLAGACIGVPPTGMGDGIEAEAMDLRADPCADFYQYSCGNWTFRHDHHPETAARGRWGDRQQESRRLFDVVTVAQDLPDRDPGERAVARYFRSCRNAARGDEQARQNTLRRMLERTEVSSPVEGVKALAELHADGVEALFWLGSDKDFDSDTNIMHLSPGGVSLPEREHYLDPRFEPLREKYLRHVEQLSTIVRGAPIDASAVLAVETRLALATRDRVAQRDVRARRNPSTFAEVQRLFPAGALDAYLAAAELRAPAMVNLTEPEAIARAGELLADRGLASYLRWRVLEAHAGTLGGEAAAEEHRFHRRELAGVGARPSDLWTCFLDTWNTLPALLARLYVSRRFSETARTRATEVASAVSDQMRESILTRDWLDETTRSALLGKLDKLLLRVGFPETWPDLGAIPDIDPVDHLGNRIAVARWGRRVNLARLGTPFDRGAFALSPTTINAAYSPFANQMVFPAAILQWPVFSPGGSGAWNFGAMGAVMGHEITHAFDDEGRHFDGEGRLAELWSDGVTQAFDERARCVVDRAMSFAPAPGRTLDGRFTLGENIADLGGVKLAFDAYRATGEAEAPGQLLSRAQQFFVAYAQTWCEVVRPEYVDLRIGTDPHAPGRFRVNGVLGNLPAFADAWKCGAGVPMVAPQQCRIW